MRNDWLVRLVLFFLFNFTFSLRLGLCQSDPVSDLAHDPQWLHLGHYQKKFLGGYKSKITSSSFFLSPEGSSHPESELRATLKALQNPQGILLGRLKQPIHCAFPARTAWINSHFHIQPPKDPCPDFDEWKQALQIQSVTVVFSSAYPNNPASMFGHTLLRLNQKNQMEISNYGVNFEAKVDPQDSSLLFALKGLFGFYEGAFGLSPYYMKINEYNYSENRDLWEYDLSLTPQQISLLVEHIWELYGMGNFNYYFLDENCSYQLLALLEVAQPQWNLTSPAWIYALPIDTIKQIQKQPNAIVGEHYRPSLYKKLNLKVSHLNPQQYLQWQRILSFKENIESIQDPSVLSSAISFLDYQRQKKGGQLTPEQDQLFRRTLIRRSQLGNKELSEKETSPPQHSSPLETHDSASLDFGTRFRNNQWGLELGWRPAFHDFLDPPYGFPFGFQVDVAHIQLAYFIQSHSLELQELNLINIISLYPYNSLDHQFSWALRSQLYRPLDFGTSTNMAGKIEAGPGIAFSLFDSDTMIYGLILASFDYIPNLLQKGRYGPTLELGFLSHLSERLSIQSSLQLHTELNRPFQRSWFADSSLSFSYTFSQSHQIRAGYRFSQNNLTNIPQPSDMFIELRKYF